MAIRVEHSGDSVVIRLGLAGILAMRGRLDIPRSHITSVTAMQRNEVPYTKGTWLRAPGTYVPGLLEYGSYGREPHREFWAVARHREVVVIDVRNWAYHRVVLGVRDPYLFAAEIGRLG